MQIPGLVLPVCHWQAWVWGCYRFSDLKSLIEFSAWG